METKHKEEQVYPSVLAGTFLIDYEGRIWRHNRRAEHKTGKYFQVRVMRNGIRHHALAHRLVWLHFNGPIPGVLQINHKNGNGLDNRPENLELVTASENTRHSIHSLKRGNTLRQSGESNHMSKLTETQVATIRRLRSNGQSLKQIAEKYGVTFQTISKIVRGQRWIG